MKPVILIFICSLSFKANQAQNIDSAQKLTSEGIVLYDEGNFKGAIQKYDSAIAINKEYYNAWYEKSYTEYTSKNLDESIRLSKYILGHFPNNPDNAIVYSNLGSSLDDQGNTNAALSAFREGLRIFPDNYLLHFNEGVTLSRMGENENALSCFQLSLKEKPLHPGSNYFTGMLLQDSNKVPALLATMLFLAIEPKGEVTSSALERLQQILYGDIKRDSTNHFSININNDVLRQSKKETENDFSTVELVMDLAAVTSNDKRLKKKDDATKLNNMMQMIVNSLKENQNNGAGFYWKFYVPFYIALTDQGYLPTLTHIIYSSEDDPGINKWLTDHKDNVEEFYLWLKNYNWSFQSDDLDPN